MSSAFFYVDGIPTKGKWIELDLIDSMDEVMINLAEAKLIPVDEDGDPNYGGDVLVADADDLAKAFYHSRSDTLDLDDFVDARDFCARNHVDEDAVISYMGWADSWSRDNFDESFAGSADSERAFAEQLVDDLGYLNEMPDHLRMYFDYEAFAHDIFINSYYFADGYVFRTN